MKEEFVTYKQALRMKELGFDWECQSYYNLDSAPDGQAWLEVGVHCVNRNMRDNMVSAPTQAVAARWLREVYNVAISVDSRYKNAYEVYAKQLDKSILRTFFLFDLWDSKNPFPTYEAALSAGLTAALELIDN